MLTCGVSAVGLIMGFLLGVLFDPLRLVLYAQYQLGGLNVMRYGGGPNGPMRTLGQYMLGSAATFGYVCPSGDWCILLMDNKILHVNRKRDQDGREKCRNRAGICSCTQTTSDPPKTGDQEAGRSEMKQRPGFLINKCTTSAR